MSQQGENPTAHEDEWWRKLYDGAAPDTGPAAAPDSLDDRFDSAADAVSSPAAGPGGAVDEPPDPGAYGDADDDPVPYTDTDFDAGGPPGAGPRTAAPQAGSGDVEDFLVADHDHEDTVITDAWWGTGPAAPSPPASPAATPRPPVSGPPPQRPPVPRPAPPPSPVRFAAPWETPAGPPQPRTFAVPVPPPSQETPAEPVTGRHAKGPAQDGTGTLLVETGRRPGPTGHLGDRPPTYEAEPATLPAATSLNLDGLVPDTVLDGARYGTFTLRTVSARGDSARFRGEPRGDALLTARFGSGEGALVLVAVARGERATEGAHLAAADACHWIGSAVGRSHARLSEDIRSGRRGDLKSGLHRLTDRTYGKLRSRAAELGLEPREHTVALRCLLLSADPRCRTRVFFGVGGGGLFRLRDGVWQNLEPALPEGGAATGEAVVGFGSPPRPPDAGAATDVAEDRLTMDLQIVTPPGPYIEDPLPPPSEPFRFRASVARSGDTLLLCSSGLADPMRGEPALAGELAARWAPSGPPGLAEFLADIQLRIKGYADDRTAAAVWEA